PGVGVVFALRLLLPGGAGLYPGPKNYGPPNRPPPRPHPRHILLKGGNCIPNEEFKKTQQQKPNNQTTPYVLIR
ncbi:hypothetical protein, partial [Enterobacter intestinihominis]